MDEENLDSIIGRMTIVMDKMVTMSEEMEKNNCTISEMNKELVETVENIVQHNINEAKIYDRHLTQLEADRAMTNRRCDELLKQHRQIIKQNECLIEEIKNEREKNERIMSRCDRLISILGSFADAGGSANVTITNHK